MSNPHEIRGPATGPAEWGAERPAETSRGPLDRRFGIGLRGNLAPGAYARLGLLAEEMGFDVVSAFHDLGEQPALVPLLEVAKVTRRVSVGPACLNPYTMRPAEIASVIGALNDASGGRAYLGLARGAWLDTLGIDQRDAVTRVRAAAEFVRTRLDVPLLIGGWGRRMVALAGEIAQELKIGGSANPDLVPVIREWLGGRRPGIVLGAVTVVDEDGEAARAHARAAVQPYFEVVARYDPTISGPLDRISDELLARFTFAGTPEEVARHVSEVFAAGASRVEFGAPFGLDHVRGLRLLGESVIPRVRGE